MDGLIKEMKIQAKEEFHKQNYEYDDGECVGVNTYVAFNFDNKNYNIEMQCYWEKGHWYSYKLKDGDKIISDGMVRL